MTISWQDARDKVRGDLWRPGTSGVPDDVCDRALHASLLDLEAKRTWLWLENISQTTPLAAQSNQIPAPTTLRALASVSVVREDGSIDDALSLMTLGRIRLLQTQQVVGWPSSYALSGGTIYLDAAADVDCALEIIGTLKTPDDISNAIAMAEAIPTLQLQQQAIIAGACAWISATYLKNDAEAARQSAAYQRITDRLMDAEDDARSDSYGGLAVPDTGYRDMAGC